jgi:hypothetical protein
VQRLARHRCFRRSVEAFQPAFHTDDDRYPLRSGRSRQPSRMSQIDPNRSISLIGCQRLDSAKIGRSLEPFAMAAYGSESGRWANTHFTSAGDPKRPFAPRDIHQNC